MLIAFISIALLLTINVFVSRMIRRGSDARFKQNMLIAMVWAVPVLGLFVAMGHTSPRPSGAQPEVPLKGTSEDPAPHELHAPGLVPVELAAYIHSANGFPLIDWDGIGQWASAAPNPADAMAAGSLARRAWLLHMRDACGPSFRLYETDDAYILSPLENSTLSATAAYISTTRKRISAVLRGVASFAENEKSILLVLHDEDAYYDYVSAYYPDQGEFAFSSGMFIHAGCPHFVVTLADLAAIERVIAHEMTHSALSHLALPRWLDEGLAVNTEQRLTGVPALIYTPQELRNKHLQYWGTDEVQQFWSGESFFRTDDGNLLSYELARILVTHLSGDWERFKNFVANAGRNDAGMSAARDHLAVDLGALVCALLEQPYAPEWEPNSAAWESEAEPAAA